MKHPQEIISTVFLPSFQVPEIYEKEQLAEAAHYLNLLVYGEEHTLREAEAAMAKFRLQFDHLSYMQIMIDVHKCFLVFSHSKTDEHLSLLTTTRSKVEHVKKLYPENLALSLPPMLIQPHVEQVLSELLHSGHRQSPALLDIGFSETDQHLWCSILYKQTAPETQSSTMASEALQIAQQRIELLNKINDNEISVERQINKNDGQNICQITLRFPI